MTNDRLRPVRLWLYCLALLILIMVAVGGLTRLTGSGLSITSWKPIAGIIPPLSASDWRIEFEAYQRIPEFQIENRWMEIADFKSIFWWEWGHRFLGRMIGFAFLGPFLVFLAQKRLSWRLAPGLGLLFVLGGFQGFLGWWMVASGLSERTDVSQYRLAAHLAAATALFGAILFVARRLIPTRFSPSKQNLRWSIRVLALLVLVQIVLGAFVAGIDAGFGYNTWPLIDGTWVPDGLATLEPWWRNAFENALAVQFNHRVFAYVIVLFALVVGWRGRALLAKSPHQWFLVVLILLVAQLGLGIATLLLVVPIPLAVAHQSLALILFGVLVVYLADMSRQN